MDSLPQPFLLKDSKLFELSRNVALFDDLVPDIRIQMIAESDIDTTCPRDETLGEATRILVNYTNTRGNSSLYQIIDTSRLEKPSTVDIDDFLSKYTYSVYGEAEVDDPIMQSKRSLVSALVYSLTVCLGMSDEVETHSAKVLAEWFVKAAISVVYNDPRDVLIMLKDIVLEDKETVATTIDKMWVVKVRT